MSPTFLLTLAVVLLISLILVGMICLFFISNRRKILLEQQKQLEQIRKSEQKYAELFNNVSDIVFIHTLDGIIEEVNETVTRELGYAVAEVIGKSLLEFVPPERNPLLGTYLEGVQRLGEFSGLMEIRCKNGQFKIFDYRNNLIRENGKAIAVRGIARNVTEKQKTLEALRESEERYRLFFEHDLTGDFIASPDGEICACNPAFASIFGFASVDEAMQCSFSDFFPGPDAYQQFLQKLNQQTSLEYYEDELVNIHGETVHVIENIIGVFNDEGQLTFIRGYIFDNTERKQLEQQILHYHKMQSIGTLAGGVAHDFNNILNIVEWYSEKLKKDDLTPAAKQKYLRSIQIAITRGATLVEQILTFARKAEIHFGAVNVNNIIRELADIVGSTFPRTIELELRLDEAIPVIRADQGQIYQSLLNLLVNARDAMPTGGTITIATAVVSSETVQSRFSDARETEYVCIRISDTGCGMDGETRKRLFDPFFTTKRRGQGTGLGLSVVYGIVTSHLGFIDVESAPGDGTTFYFYFPKAADTPHAVIESPEKGGKPLRKGSETLLIVEDEEMLLELLEETFVQHGYVTLIARDGQEAVQVYEQNKDKIDLVFSDSGLPRLSGWEAFQKIKQIDPEARAVFASGFLDPELKSQLINIGVEAFVQKPYTPNSVLKVVRETLDRGA